MIESSRVSRVRWIVTKKILHRFRKITRNFFMIHMYVHTQPVHNMFSEISDKYVTSGSIKQFNNPCNDILFKQMRTIRKLSGVSILWTKFLLNSNQQGKTKIFYLSSGANNFIRNMKKSFIIFKYFFYATPLQCEREIFSRNKER